MEVKETNFSLLILFFPQTFPEEEETSATEFDLGTKIKTPKEVMLEELSLMKGKGSKMFKLRQQRVDKFIISAENLVSLLKRIPCSRSEVQYKQKIKCKLCPIKLRKITSCITYIITFKSLILKKNLPYPFCRHL